MARILVSGLARKFCTMTSWMPLYSRDTLRIAKIESARSASVSPMPIRMPVVNGTLLRPGVLQHPQADLGVLVGGAEVRRALLGEQAPRRRLEHHAHGRRDRLEPLEVLPGHDARVEVRQQAGLLKDADRHRPDVGERVVVAVRVQPLAGLRPAGLGPVAQREQRFLAAERGALAGRCRAPRPG